MKNNSDTAKKALMNAMLNSVDSMPSMSVYYPETRVLFRCNSGYPYWLDIVCNRDGYESRENLEKGFEKIKSINRK